MLTDSNGIAPSLLIVAARVSAALTSGWEPSEIVLDESAKQSKTVNQPAWSMAKFKNWDHCEQTGAYHRPTWILRVNTKSCYYSILIRIDTKRVSASLFSVEVFPIISISNSINIWPLLLHSGDEFVQRVATRSRSPSCPFAFRLQLADFSGLQWLLANCIANHDFTPIHKPSHPSHAVTDGISRSTSRFDITKRLLIYPEPMSTELSSNSLDTIRCH